MTFDQDFSWGAAIPATTAWGAAPASDLAAWSGRLANPGAGSHLGGGSGADSAEVFALLAGLGIRHLRLTLDWARIEPTNGRQDVEAVEGLRLELAAAHEAGMAVWGCLHDGPLPGWFAHDERGFGDARSRGYFWARHVEFVGEAFGDLVHGWVPVAEPARWAQRGWLTGERPPGRVDDAEAFAAALEAVHLASVDAALRLRGGGQPVASAEWLVPLFPARPGPDAPPTPDAEAMTSVADEALWGCWRRMIDEEALVVPGRPPVEVPGAREAFDLIGFTYRHSSAVRGDGALLPYPQALPRGPEGQVPWAEGLAIALHRVAEELPGRALLAGGVGIATADDEEQEHYLRDALAIAAGALDGGIDLRGLWWDSPVDPVVADGTNGAERGGLLEGAGTARPAARLLASVVAGAPVPT